MIADRTIELFGNCLNQGLNGLFGLGRFHLGRSGRASESHPVLDIGIEEQT